jgi:hypothetical protein
VPAGPSSLAQSRGAARPRARALSSCSCACIQLLVAVILSAHPVSPFLPPSQDEQGRTPLHVAATLGHAGVVAQLLSARNRECGAAAAPAERARLQGLRDGRGLDALAAAVAAGHAGCVTALLRGGFSAAASRDAVRLGGGRVGEGV